MWCSCERARWTIRLLRLSTSVFLICDYLSRSTVFFFLFDVQHEHEEWQRLLHHLWAQQYTVSTHYISFVSNIQAEVLDYVVNGQYRDVVLNVLLRCVISFPSFFCTEEVCWPVSLRNAHGSPSVTYTTVHFTEQGAKYPADMLIIFRNSSR